MHITDGLRVGGGFSSFKKGVRLGGATACERIARQSGFIWSGGLHIAAFYTYTCGKDSISSHWCNTLWFHFWNRFSFLVDFSTRVISVSVKRGSIWLSVCEGSS